MGRVPEGLEQWVWVLQFVPDYLDTIWCVCVSRPAPLPSCYNYQAGCLWHDLPPPLTQQTRSEVPDSGFRASKPCIGAQFWTGTWNMQAIYSSITTCLLNVYNYINESKQCFSIIFNGSKDFQYISIHCLIFSKLYIIYIFRYWFCINHYNI